MHKNLHPNLKQFIPLVSGIADTVGSHCEVVLHDFSKLPDSVIAIANGHVSGRHVGSPQNEHSLNIIKQKRKSTDNFIRYSSRTEDGKILTCSSFFIRDEKGEAIGVFCINIDTTSIKAAHLILESMLSVEDDKNIAKSKNDNADNIERIIFDMVENDINEAKTPVAYLNKDQKIEIVKKLFEKGVFLVKGSIDHVADSLCVSRYTIYNYLEEIKQEDLERGIL